MVSLTVKNVKTNYEIEIERAIAGGGRAGWEARESLKRHGFGRCK